MARSIASLIAGFCAFCLVGVTDVADSTAAELMPPAESAETEQDGQARSDSAAAPPSYVLLALGGKVMKWGEPAFGSGATIRYAFVTRWTDRPGARNCGVIGPLASGLDRGDLRPGDFETSVRGAMDAWQAAADVRFVAAPDQDTADLLIGIQRAARGIAFGDVIPGVRAGDGIASIARAAICFNPDLRWDNGFDRNPATSDIEYVAAHELGHVIGLDHAWGERTLMSFRYREAFRHPQPGDRAGAARLYGPSPIQRAPAHARGSEDAASAMPGRIALPAE